MNKMKELHKLITDLKKGDIELVQQAIQILKGGGKQGQAVSQEVLKSVKEVIAKYEEGYLSFLKIHKQYHLLPCSIH